jgi:hypothetical protein
MGIFCQCHQRCKIYDFCCMSHSASVGCRPQKYYVFCTENGGKSAVSSLRGQSPRTCSVSLLQAYGAEGCVEAAAGRSLEILFSFSENDLKVHANSEFNRMNTVNSTEESKSLTNSPHQLQQRPASSKRCWVSWSSLPPKITAQSKFTQPQTKSVR